MAKYPCDSWHMDHGHSDDKKQLETGLSRRDFGRQALCLAALGLGAGLGGDLLAPDLAVASTRRVIRLPSTRGLWLYNENTNEHMRVAHVRRGYYDVNALTRLDWLLRDHHVNKYRPMSRRLYDILYVTQAQFGADRPLVITSGYRTRATNEKLAEYIPGVAVNSLHIEGAAVDFQIPERGPKAVAGFLNGLGVGGVGRYPSHVHVDVGKIRQWSRV